MAKALHRLTVKQVENATKGTTLTDGGGLSLRTAAQGNRRWVLRFKLRGRPQREMGLGSFPATTLAQARQKAAQARELVAKGVDPIEDAERSAEAAKAEAQAAKADVMTFGQYAEDTFLPTVLPNFSNPAHIQQWEATFRKHAAKLRDLPLASITREEILDVLRPIWTTKSVTASRSRERLERMFSHAIQNGYYRGDNPAAWRQFDATLPAPRKLTRGHHASIPHDEIAPFIEKLRDRQAESTAALMLEWIALSASRTGEARLATWSEIDLDRMIWSIPADRMKMRRDHVVPITERMATILHECQRRLGRDATPEDWLFPGPREGKPLSEMAGIMQLKRMDYGQFTVHGLRATFKGWAATCTEFPRELIEEQLAHQLGAVERAYMRTTAVERRRPMMEAWAAHLAGQEVATGGRTWCRCKWQKRRGRMTDDMKQIYGRWTSFWVIPPRRCRNTSSAWVSTSFCKRPATTAGSLTRITSGISWPRSHRGAALKPGCMSAEWSAERRSLSRQATISLIERQSLPPGCSSPAHARHGARRWNAGVRSACLVRRWHCDV